MSSWLTSIKAKIMTDDMTRHGTIMVAFGLMAGLINYGFQLTMAIMLTPAQYGTLYSLLSLLVILSIFSSAINTSITKFASTFKAQGKLDRVSYLWRFYLKRTFIIGLAAFLVLSLLSPLISGFLNIDNNWYLIVLFLSLILVFMLPVNYGILRGTQRFIPLGSSNTLIAFLKLSVGALLVYLGWGVYGGLFAFIIAQVAVFAITLFFLRDLTRVGNEKVEIRGFHSYAALSMLAIAAFTLLTNIDVILVKHYLGPEVTGNYSAISTLGKVAFIAPGGIAIAMFPKTSELFEANSAHRPVLLKAILLTVLLAGGVVVIYWLFPQFITNFLFGGKYSLVSPYLFKYGGAMLLFAISFLLMNYFLSLNQTKVAYSLVVAMLAQLGLIIAFHSTIAEVVNIMLISGFLSVALMLPLYLKMRSIRSGNNLSERIE